MKNWYLPIIGALVVLVFVAGIGGYMMGSAAGEQKANNARRDFAAQRFQGLAGNGQGTAFPGQGSDTSGAGAGRTGGNAGMRPATSGTVKSIDGKTMVVTTRDGEVKVQLADNTAVTKTDRGTAQDIKAGMRVSVMGETAASGVVNATSVQVVAAGN